MKVYICTVALLFVAVFVLKPCQAYKADEAVINIVQSCMNETGLTNAFKDNEVNTNDTKVMCYTACVLKEMKWINEDGKVNEDGKKKMPKLMYKEVVDFIWDICSKKANEAGEVCDIGMTLYHCLHDNGIMAYVMVPVIRNKQSDGEVSTQSD